MNRFFILSVALALSVSAYACSDDETTPNPATNTDGGTSTDGGGTTDSGGGTDSGGTDSGGTQDTGATDSGGDAGQVLCTAAELDAPGADFTGADAGIPVITFPTDEGPQQYQNRCVKIKAGAMVTWQGAFQNHPLQAAVSTGTSPIPALTGTAQNDNALTVTFPNAGTFQFQCQFHPFQMYGAVKVVP